MKRTVVIATFILAFVMIVCSGVSAIAETPFLGRTLTIWYTPNTFPNIDLLDEFMSTYPEVRIKTVPMQEEDPLERLAAVNLTGNNEIDLFMLPDYRIDSQVVFKRGYAAPLQSAKLKNDVLNMYPQIQRALMKDGMLLAYPAILYPDCWTFNPQLFEQAGFEAVPQTFDAYIDMMLSWYKADQASLVTQRFNISDFSIEDAQINSVILIVKHILGQDAQEHTPLLDSPEFRSALTKLSQLSQWKEEPLPVSIDRLIDTPCVFNSKAHSPFIQFLNAQHSMLPPTLVLGDDPVISANLEYFILNPASDNMEDAIRFLEYYSEHMNLDTLYTLYPNLNEPVIRKGSEDLHSDKIAVYREKIDWEEHIIKDVKDTEAPSANKERIEEYKRAIVALEQERYVYPESTIALYRQLAPYITVEPAPRVWVLFEDLGAKIVLHEYFEGNRTLDQTVDELDRLLALLYPEH